MKAKINTYDPLTDYCDIMIGNRVYELEGINQLIADHYKYKNTPVPLGPYYAEILKNLDSYTLKTLLEDLKAAIEKAETPIAIA